MNKRLRAFFLLMFAFFALQTLSAQEKSLADTLLVGVAGNEPFLVDTSLRSGIAIEIWAELADNLHIPYKVIYYEDVPHALAALEQNKVQAAAGPITITAERAEQVQFTQPYYQSSLSIMSITDHPSIIDRILPLFSYKFFIALAIFLFILAVVGAFLWLAERKKNPKQFPSEPVTGIANGMWCAIATMTTTGYGDIAPKTFWGRFTAGAWMVVSIIFATSLIAGISSVLTLGGIHTSSIKMAEELSGKKVAAVLESPAEDFVQQNGGKVITIDNIAQGYQMLKSKKVDAVVFDRPQLLYYLKEHPDEDASVSAAEYQRQGYGFAFSLSEKNMHNVNVALLNLKESGTIERITKKWLGNQVQ